MVSDDNCVGGNPMGAAPLHSSGSLTFDNNLDLGVVE
jgi:hypothetical protein